MKSYAKINVFLKITGVRDGYHELVSRFLLIDDIYDELVFDECDSGKFSLIANADFGGYGTIGKALDELIFAGYEEPLREFFKTHRVNLIKHIPICAGLGGGSSNAATFLKLCNDEINLGIKPDELMKIGAKVGSDVSFFLSGFKSANVSGVGEIIEEFKDIVPPIFVRTPSTPCYTAEVYGAFDKICTPTSMECAQELAMLSTTNLLNLYDPHTLNDLLKPALWLYKTLDIGDAFLSGSGGSCFVLADRAKKLLHNQS